MLKFSWNEIDKTARRRRKFSEITKVLYSKFWALFQQYGIVKSTDSPPQAKIFRNYTVFGNFWPLFEQSKILEGMTSNYWGGYIPPSPPGSAPLPWCPLQVHSTQPIYPPIRSTSVLIKKRQNNQDYTCLKFKHIFSRIIEQRAWDQLQQLCIRSLITVQA